MTDPIHIISLGAGVQSSTMALMAAHGEIKPMPKCAIFADTQDEPASVYKWLDWLEKQLPFLVHRITRGSLSEKVLLLKPRQDGTGMYANCAIPAYTIGKVTGSHGIRPRICTTNFKIEPLDQEQRRVIGVKTMKEWRQRHKAELKEWSLYRKSLATWKRYKKAEVSKLGPPPVWPDQAWKSCQIDPLCVSWIGISLDEMSRMKQPRQPWQNFRYPLVDMRIRRGGCVEWMARHGYPKPPRSACVYCPYHSDTEWRRLRDEEPAEFAKAVAFDKAYRESQAQVNRANSIPFLHASRKPLDEVDFSTDEDHGQQIMFGNECEGICGV